MTAVMDGSVFLLASGAPAALRPQGQAADVRLNLAKLMVMSDCSGLRGIRRIRAATAGGIRWHPAQLNFGRCCVGRRGAWSKTESDEDERVSSSGFIGADNDVVRGVHAEDVGGSGPDCAAGWLAG
jgi:hypothetical protein